MQKYNIYVGTYIHTYVYVVDMYVYICIYILFMHASATTVVYMISFVLHIHRMYIKSFYCISHHITHHI